MATVHYNKLYALQLWLLTVLLVAPIVLGLTSMLNQANYLNNSANIGVIFLFAIMGLFFSLPTFLVVGLTYTLLHEKLSVVTIKLLVTVIAILGVFLTFWLIGGSMVKTYSLVYAGSILFANVFVKVRK
jgi:hypothetical protein